MHTESLIRPSAGAHGTAGMPTICAAFQATAARYPNRVALRLCGEGIEWNWDEYAVRVRRAAQTLHALGVRRGDRVALLLGERPEHLLADLAVVHLGATPFSICGTSAPPQVEYIVRDSGARLLISEAAFEASAAALAARCGGLEHVVRITSGAPELDSVDSPAFDFEQSWRAVTPDDLVCLIYTLGTTGPPQRAEITHQGVLSGLRGTWRTLSGPATVPAVSFLPLAHVGGRFIIHYSAIALAATVTCCADAAALPTGRAETRWTAFGAPRWVWQKPPSACAALRADPNHFLSAAGLGQLELACLVDPPAPVALLESFRGAGSVSSRQSRGVTEAGGAGTTHIDDGTSGRAIDTLELTIVADRPVFAPGPIVIRGYHDLPQQVAETIRQHGRLHTRNFGGLANEWPLTITDRTQPLIIDTSGKDMPAANIKADPNSATPLIGQAAFIGGERPFDAAPTRLDPERAACEHDTARAGKSESAVSGAHAGLCRVKHIERRPISTLARSRTVRVHVPPRSLVRACPRRVARGRNPRARRHPHQALEHPPEPRPRAAATPHQRSSPCPNLSRAPTTTCAPAGNRGGNVPGGEPISSAGHRQPPARSH